MAKKQKIKSGYVKFGWNGQINSIDFIVKISKLICQPVNTMRELDGDFYMSDYHKLAKAADLLHIATEEIKDVDMANIPKTDTGNVFIDNALDNNMNMARLQAATVHKRQMIKRIGIIRDVARKNNIGNVDIQGAALSHIVDLADALFRDYSDYKEPEEKDDANT
jgi:hypothetical protein